MASKPACIDSIIPETIRAYNDFRTRYNPRLLGFPVVEEVADGGAKLVR
jgi:hypothetical protein